MTTAFNRTTPLPLTTIESSAIAEYQRHHGDLAALGSLMLRRIGLVGPRKLDRENLPVQSTAGELILSSPLSVAERLLHPVGGFVHFCESASILLSRRVLQIVRHGSSHDGNKKEAPQGTPRLELSDSSYPRVTRRARPGGSVPIRLWTKEGGGRAS